MGSWQGHEPLCRDARWLPSLLCLELDLQEGSSELLLLLFKFLKTDQHAALLGHPELDRRPGGDHVLPGLPELQAQTIGPRSRS